MLQAKIKFRLKCLTYNHWQKSWDTFAFLGCFPIHTGPTHPLTPETTLHTCIQKFFRVSTLYRVGWGRNARKFRKGCTILRGNREMTEIYEYCSTVPRTFVQDCRLNLNFLSTSLRHRRNWTLVKSVCETAPKSLFLAPPVYQDLSARHD